MKDKFNHEQMVEIFLDTTLKMGSIFDTNELITFLAVRMAQMFQSERVSCMLLDPEKEELSIEATHGFEPPKSNLKKKLGQMFAGWVAKEGKPLLVRDVKAEYPELSGKRAARYKGKSFAVVPIKIKNEVIGIFSLTDRKDDAVFTHDDLALINSLCHSLATNLENIRLVQENSDLVTVDNLTGLFNHRYFQEHLLEEIYRAERYKHAFSVLMLDIDDFNKFNHIYGYTAGDSALKQIGKILKDNTRRVDVACRFGPEEFIIILPNTQLESAIFAAEKIKECIAYSVFAGQGTSSEMARLTVSIGVTQHQVGLDNEELAQQLTVALLEAKQKGKNRVCAFK